MIKGTHDELGRLDILVNNVGIQYVSPVHTFPEDKWDAIIAVCLSSAFHSTKAALPFMLEQGWGRIINTGSMHALVASPYKSAYNAAKHGIAGAVPADAPRQDLPGCSTQWRRHLRAVFLSCDQPFLASANGQRLLKKARSVYLRPQQI